MTYFRDIRAIARHLRSQGLPEVIDQEVEIRSLDTAAMDVTEALERYLPPGPWTRTGTPNTHGFVSKYRLFDLSFSQPWPPSISLPLLGREELRGLLLQESIEDILESMSRNRLFLRLGLSSNEECDADVAHQILMTGTVPQGYFPRTFVVTGAHLSNHDYGCVFYF
jgi:hypothetical protein